MSEATPVSPLSMVDCHALILAGGMGQRLRTVVSDRPKAMAPVLGKPFLFWLIVYLRRIGIQHIVVSAGYMSEQVASLVNELDVDGVRVQCVAEKAPLGTGGAIRWATDKSRFKCHCWLIVNGDSITTIDIEGAMRRLTPEIQGIVFGTYKEDTADCGSLSVDSQNGIVGFHEKMGGSGWVNAGIYLLRSETIERFPNEPCSLEKEIFPMLISRGDKFCLMPCRHDFLDIGTPASYAVADEYMQRHFKDIVCDDYQ